MAFEVRKIDPLDLQPRKAIGVSLPFSSSGVFKSTYQTKDAIRTNLVNYFMTSRKERYLNPEFGNILPTYLFEQLTPEKVREVDRVVKQDLKRYFPKVEPIEINTVGIPDENTIQFSLRYKIKDTNVEDEVVLNFVQ